MNQQALSYHNLDVRNLPATGWLRVRASDREVMQAIERQHDLTLNHTLAHASEQAAFILLPIKLPLLERTHAPGYSFHTVELLIVVSAELVITVEPDQAVRALDEVHARVSSQAVSRPSHELVLMLLEELNETVHECVSQVSLMLNELADEAVISGGGFAMGGRQVGVADIAQTAVSLGQTEELIARIIEAQLMLERSIRWLRRTAMPRSSDESMLLSDVQGGRRHSRFQHTKVRNIQQSLMTTLDLKQNQIIKVFTVVTAVFTPPTLIAAYYGQNFANMPELAVGWGEWFVMIATAVFALVPLVYIKRRGWLR